jgi:uncharacterized protein (DUF1684 family)
MQDSKFKMQRRPQGKSRSKRPSLRFAYCILHFAFCISLISCNSGPSAPDDSSYVQEIEAGRARRDKAYRESDDPIPPEKRAIFLPLRYYAPDRTYAVPAELRLFESRQNVEVPTSTGTVRRMELVGTLNFTLDGQQMSLGALVPAGTRQIQELFVPFADLTTGKDTYKAGRYLDIPPTATGLYTVDFNEAYNPTCAYNESYECPYPPPSNRLKIEIRAGEKAPGA